MSRSSVTAGECLRISEKEKAEETDRITDIESAAVIAIVREDQVLLAIIFAADRFGDRVAVRIETDDTELAGGCW